MGGLSINGRSGGFNFSYDGVTNKDTGSNSGNYAAPALDSIAEVRVQTSNFQAEYGRSSGATITVITAAARRTAMAARRIYKRDTSLNGNEFSRRQQCGLGVTAQCEPPLYRFDNEAWTLGGPVLIPGIELQQAAATSCSSSSRRTSCRAPIRARSTSAACRPRSSARGTSRRRSTAQGRSCTSAIRCCAATAASTTGGPACFPGNIIPAEPDRRGRPPHAEPVPAAERRRTRPATAVQLHLPDRAGLAAQRPGAADRLERRAATRRSTGGCSSATRSAPAASRCSARRPAGRSSRASTRSTRSVTSTRCCTPSTRPRSPN